MLVVAGLFLPRAIANAGSYETIDGSGSSWAYIALSQWINDVQAQGMQINYNPDGSEEGRSDYIQGGIVDFAGSDPPFLSASDKLAGLPPQQVPWGYSYVPDTAGGTAFMYHLTVDGHLVRNLRLNAQVLFGIFTGAITNWDDPQITKIYGAQLPNEPIVPVLRADGSGATFFFTLWLDTLFPGPWNAFCHRIDSKVVGPCGNTEFFPHFGHAVMESGSNNVADYITANYGEGTIGYDEYAYALNSGYPVVQVLNPDNYFVGPTAGNVAVALTQAQINEHPNDPNFLQQNLTSVYSYKDPRSYPLSSYSYLIVPREGKPIPKFYNTGAGATLSEFIHYFLCAGQQKSADLGYSPLPLGLVKGGLLQVSYLPGHAAGTDTLGNCDNPTFNSRGQLTILATAPQPSPCQKLGAPLNCVVRNGKAVTGNSPNSNSGGSNTGGSKNSGTTGPGGSTTGGTNPNGGATNAANVTGNVVNLAGSSTDRALLAILTALAVIMAVATPPAVGVLMRRRKKQNGA
jgi:ABC-type phosphate transport system substrate-binding protein